MTTAVADRVAPLAWGATLSGNPTLDRSIAGGLPVLVRRWQGIAPAIDQSALDQHYMSVHLGGPKRLHRRGEGASRERDVPCGAHSVVPAGSTFRWDTEGPVDFVHVYFEPKSLDDVIADAFDRDPARVTLHDSLGEHDPLIASLALALVDELESKDVQRAYLEGLIHLMVCRMLRLNSDARACSTHARQPLAPFRLRRALDFIEASIALPIGVDEIAEASGISVFHFSRAFRQTTGKPPYAYLLDRRIGHAKRLLMYGHVSLTIIAAKCGFASSSQFSRMFRQQTGVTPTQFRETI